MTEEENSKTESAPAAEAEGSGTGLRYSKSNASCRRCRRLGVKLFLKGERCFSQKCAFVRRQYAPGQHGQSHRRQSDYGKQLQAKQMAAAIYGLNNQELRNVYNHASKVKASTKEEFAQRLERRLDNVIYQAGLAFSRRHARQMVSHGKVSISKQKILSPSYLISKAEVIKITSKNDKAEKIDVPAQKKAPEWVKVGKDTITILDLPKNISERLGFDIQLIIEYFSR